MSRSTSFIFAETQFALVACWLACFLLAPTLAFGEESPAHKEDERPHLVIVIAEDEYGTAKSLPKFAQRHLAKEYRITLVQADRDEPNRLLGIEALSEADVALFSIRRRTPPLEQLAIIRRYIESGKPLVALRTSSHAFSLRNKQPAQGYSDWPEFGKQVIGCNYHGHYSNKAKGDQRTVIWSLPAASDHPILQGVDPSEQTVASGLYKNLPLAESATPLVMGRFGDAKPHEPVAWTNTTEWKGKVFYAALGDPTELADKNIAKILVNGVRWAVGSGDD